MLLLIQVVVSSSSSSSSTSNKKNITLHRNSENDKWGFGNELKNGNLYVTQVTNNSGLKVNDKILSINSQKFRDETEFVNIMKNVKGLELKLVVERN
jgi:hypothetical protein